MKKLNQTVLRILSMKIHSELTEAANKLQKELDAATLKTRKEKAKLIVAAVTKEIKHIVQLPEEVRSRIGLAYRWNATIPKVADVVNSLKKTQTKIDVPNLRRYGSQEYCPDVYDALVIAQIDATDIDVLMSRVTSQFKK